MARAEALDRYRELPLPDTTEEHWRFTDLTGFDPDSFSHDGGQSPDAASATMLELDVAGLATIGDNGVVIERAPEGVTFAPLPEGHERLYSLIGWDEKFAAHNAAVWQHGLQVVVPAGVQLEKPLYVRVTNSQQDGSLFWRLLVVAEEGARFTLVEEVSSAAPDLRSYTSRSRTSPTRRGTSPRTTHASSATPSSTGWPAGSARRRERCESRTTSPAKARPRA